MESCRKLCVVVPSPEQNRNLSTNLHGIGDEMCKPLLQTPASLVQAAICISENVPTVVEVHKTIMGIRSNTSHHKTDLTQTSKQKAIRGTLKHGYTMSK